MKDRGDYDLALSIQMAVVKIAILSFTSYIIYLAGKTFQSHMHNWTVNKHRYSALTTFQLFTEGEVSSSTREALLLYVAQAIFAPQSTGYRGKDAGPPGAAQMVEIVRSVASEAGG